MTTPPSSPSLSPFTDAASHSPSTLKWTRKVTHLRSLVTRPVGAERPLFHVDPAIGKADGSHRKKLRTYSVIVARDKAEFDIPEASDPRTKKKILQTVGKWRRQFKFDFTSKGALAAYKDNVNDTVCEKYDISRGKWTQFCQSRRDPSWEEVRKKVQTIQKQNIVPHVLSRGGYEFREKKMIDEKKKKQLEEAA
ncbi:hypothetical protein HKD37_14G040504 [Glycine soja]